MALLGSFHRRSVPHAQSPRKSAGRLASGNPSSNSHNSRWHIQQELRRMMHEPAALVGAWLKRVVEGYYRYHVVPGNLSVLSRFPRTLAYTYAQVTDVLLMNRALLHFHVAHSQVARAGAGSRAPAVEYGKWSAWRRNAWRESGLPRWPWGLPFGPRFSPVPWRRWWPW